MVRQSINSSTGAGFEAFLPGKARQCLFYAIFSYGMLLAGCAQIPVLPSTPVDAANAPPPTPREFRAAWVATVANIDWPSKKGLTVAQQKKEIIRIVDRAKELNLNALIFQVRPAADAMYPSILEPWSEYLMGEQGKFPDPFYDPLKMWIDESHKRGIELHAWFNPYRARHTSAKGPVSRAHIAVTHPGVVKEYGGYLWMDPGEPAVLRRTLNVMLDVVKRYDVDGIHIDDYFYPYPEVGADKFEVPFPDSISYARYTRRGGTRTLSDWRRHNVDTLVQQLYRRTKALKPWVKVGISPFGIWRPGFPEQIKGFDSYEKLYGDSRLWLREGWIDYFTPQLYWPIAQIPQAYPVLLDWWLGENVLARHIWPGHNASRAAAGGTWAPDELNAQIRATRATTASGDVLFSMRALMPVNTVSRDSVSVGVATQPPPPTAAQALADRLWAEMYSAPALVPASPWLSTRVPSMPRAIRTHNAASGDHVLRMLSTPSARWVTVRALTDSGWRSWILSATQRSLVLAPRTDAAPSRVLVSSVNRYGTESRVLEIR